MLACFIFKKTTVVIEEIVLIITWLILVYQVL